MNSATIAVAGEITEDQRSAIVAPLQEFSTSRGFEFRPQSVQLVLRDGDKIAGGLLGNTNWDWLRIEILSVAEHLRGSGLGRALVEKAETIAQERGCKGAWVDTYSFQAPGFYKHLGYQVFGTLPSYPGAEQRIFFMKMLAQK